MPMRALRYATIALGSFALTNCSTNGGSAEPAGHPYAGGDTLVFTSSEGSRDQRVITGFKVYDQVHDERSEHIEQVLCEDHCSSRPGVPWSTFIAAKTTTTEEAIILSLNISCGHAFTYGFLGTRMTELDGLPMRTVSIDGLNLTDVVIIMPDTTSDEYRQHSSDGRTISRVFWSKSMGVVRYDMLNSGVTWTLSRTSPIVRRSGRWSGPETDRPHGSVP